MVDFPRMVFQTKRSTIGASKNVFNLVLKINYTFCHAVPIDRDCFSIYVMLFLWAHKLNLRITWQLKQLLSTPLCTYCLMAKKCCECSLY